MVYPLWLGYAYIDQYKYHIFSMLMGLPVFLAIVYFIVYYLIPKYLIKKKKIVVFIIIYLLAVIILTFEDILVSRYIFLPIIDNTLIEKYSVYMFNVWHIFRMFVQIQSQIFIFIAVKYLKNYIESYFEKEKLRAKVLETELNMLKGQIHPHFLFNTLNNIYTLSLDGENIKASESIEKLSDILRFTLYECNKDLIPLEKELELIKSYIDLEMLRYSKLKIDFVVPNNISSIYVIPLLYFTFIENAFKHGTSKSVNDKWLKIKLEIQSGEIYFVVQNGKNPKQQLDILNSSKGIGLENAKKRLDLYLGKENYFLEIKDEQKKFTIILKHKIIIYEN